MSRSRLPGPSGDPSRLSRLGYLLRQAAAAHRLRMERALADLDVTPPQFLVLRMLEEHVGCSNADLSRMAGLTTPTVTVIVANLKRRGALASRPHAVHGRIQHLDLTDFGRTLLAGCKERVVDVEAELQAGMTPAERDTIVAWLQRAASAEPELPA